MRIIIAIVLFFAIATPRANAQDSVKITHIRQLFDAMGVVRLGPQMLNGIIKQMQGTYTNVDNGFWDEFTKNVDFAPLIEKILPIYDRNFTDEDILQLLAFYQSPTGRRFVEKSPIITQESFKAGMEWGQQLGEKAIQRLKEKGYIKSS